MGVVLFEQRAWYWWTSGCGPGGLVGVVLD